jgi:AcrR family transcriptional regulator
MPPKVKFEKASIVNAAFEIVRKNGWQGLSARSIAEELKSSTRPIYSHLKSMNSLEEEVVKKAMELLEEYIRTPRTGDKWLDQGYGYVLFAKREKYLFKAIFDEKHNHFYKRFSAEIFTKLGEDLSDDPDFRVLSEEHQTNMRKVRWVYVHGLASLLANSFEFDEYKTEEELAHLIKIVDTLIYKGVIAVLNPPE